MMESFMNLIQLVAPRKESIVGGNEGIVQSRRRGGYTIREAYYSLQSLSVHP